MKLLLNIFGFLTIGLNLFCQTQDTVIFYKDYYRLKEVIEQKSNFKLIKTELEDGVLQVEFIRLKDNKTIFNKKYLHNEPVGVWTFFPRNSDDPIIWDFNKLSYSEVKIEGGYYFEFKSLQGNEGYKPAFISAETYMNYLNNNIHYPQDAIEENIQGQVQVQVRIDEEGKPSVTSIYKGVNPFLDCEAYRVLSEMPTWKPATKDNVPIESYTIIPIRFKIN